MANCDKDILYKEFGVNASFLIDHSNGIDKTTIEEIKNYIPLSKSISSGQVLDKDYPYEDTILVVKEMIDGLVLDLISKRLITGGLISWSPISFHAWLPSSSRDHRHTFQPMLHPVDGSPSVNE